MMQTFDRRRSGDHVDSGPVEGSFHEGVWGYTATNMHGETRRCAWAWEARAFRAGWMPPQDRPMMRPIPKRFKTARVCRHHAKSGWIWYPYGPRETWFYHGPYATKHEAVTLAMASGLKVVIDDGHDTTRA